MYVKTDVLCYSSADQCNLQLREVLCNRVASRESLVGIVVQYRLDSQKVKWLLYDNNIYKDMPRAYSISCIATLWVKNSCYCIWSDLLLSHYGHRINNGYYKASKF